MRKLLTSLLAVAVLVGFTVSASAQATVTQTTLAAAMTVSQRSANLTATTNVVVGSGLYVDTEMLIVTSIQGNIATVSRGNDSTGAASHISGATVYVGPIGGTAPGPFYFTDPQIGGCVATSEVYNLRINVQSSRVWQCTNGQWMNVIDAFAWVNPTACNSSVSGNGTGTNGFTALGTAPSIPVVEANTSATGTNTHYFVCSIPIPSRLALTKSIYVLDITAFYGVQTTGLGTQVAVLASGTLNAKTVFTKIAYPAATASQTATGLAEAVRADTGTLTIAPVVASFNVATTTAGEFYSAKFTPSVAIPVAVDNTQLLFTLSLLNTATSITITNLPGILVHYRTLQVGF